MTALAGFWQFDASGDPAAACAQMLAALAMYGPHARDDWAGNAIALGRNLYRTLPEDVHDAQPVTSTDGRFVLVADVRIDNRDELEAALGIPAGQAAEMADATVLLAAWERWGGNLFDRLLGDYAFAAWDRQEQRLTLARDPLGARPLFYHRGDGFLAFASMPKGLHALPAIARVPDAHKMQRWLLTLPEEGENSFFAGISRVEPGHVVTLTAHARTARRHWRPAPPPLRLAGAKAYADALRAELDRAVRVRLRGSEGAVAAHLSAGLDSSAVATSAATQLAASGGKVVAFTSVPHPEHSGSAGRHRFGNEGPLAAATAALHPNMEHVPIPGTAASPIADLEEYYRLFDRPMLNLCNMTWITAINRAAQARGLKVLLTGGMGNATISFDGVPRLAALLRRGRLPSWLREAAALVRNGQYRWRGVTFASIAPLLPRSLWQLVQRARGDLSRGAQYFTAIHPERLANPELAAAVEDQRAFQPRHDSVAMRFLMLDRVDQGEFNKGMLAGWGLDVRDPTADPRLIEFCMALPDEQLLADGETKAIARRAFAGRVAAEVLALHGKGYQAADWHLGFAAARAEITGEVERLANCTPAAQALDLDRLARQVENWPDGDWTTPEVITTYRTALLRGISAGDFLRRASGSNA